MNQQSQYPSQLKRPFTSAQLVNIIKKKPYTQLINGTSFTYSILNKKQNTFILGNNRFFLLKGIQSVSYARDFPSNTELPFRNTYSMPAPKSTFPLSDIQNFGCEQEKFFIHFSGQKQTKWEFICPSKICAMEWKVKLQEATSLMNEFSLSNFSKYQDFLAYKASLTKNMQPNQQNEANNFLNQSNFLGESKYQYTPQPSNNSNYINVGNNNPNLNNSSVILSTTHANLNQHYNLNNNNNNSKPFESYEDFKRNNNNGQPQNRQSETKPIQIEHFFKNNQDIINKFQSSYLQKGPQVTPEKYPENKQPDYNILNDSLMGSQLPKLIQSSTPKIQINRPPQNRQQSLINIQFDQSKIIEKEEENNMNVEIIGTESRIRRKKMRNLENADKIKVQDFILEKQIVKDTIIHNSTLNFSSANRDNVMRQIQKLKRNWTDQMISGTQECELIIGFKNYIQKISEVIIDQFHLPNETKIYKPNHINEEYSSYQLSDVVIQVYFCSENNFNSNNKRYKHAALQFKNLDYLMGTMKNIGKLKVPLMILFEYKGFQGMAKMRVSESNNYDNKEALKFINIAEFQQNTRISHTALLNQEECKIVLYEKVISNTIVNKTFFIEKLTQFLPIETLEEEENINHESEYHIFRPQFVQGQEFQGILFRDRYNQVNEYQINEKLDNRIEEVVQYLETQQSYFTNSVQLAEIIHSHGVNIRHIGQIYQNVNQKWLKKIIQAEIISRCLKIFFRFDIQNCIMSNANKSANKEKPEDRQRKRVVGFLNLIFGNTDSTYRLWKNLNGYSQHKYGVSIWDHEFDDLNVPYLLQAIQNSLKIKLSEHIHERVFFKSTQSFKDADFIEFQYDSSYYNLEFTTLFQEIGQCLEEKTYHSFHILCQILTSSTSRQVPYLQLLKNNPIHDTISEFLLNFTSPQENQQLYNRIYKKVLPCRYMYQSKLAEIKWHLIKNNHVKIQKPIEFLQGHVSRWLGQVHPLFTQLYRILAEYFSAQNFDYKLAIKYANSSLRMQELIFGTDNENLWKDHYIIGKILFGNNKIQDAFKHILKAKTLIKVQRLKSFQTYGQLFVMISKGYIALRYYQEAYSSVKQLFKVMKDFKDQASQGIIVECVGLIKYLLELNQEHEAFIKFIETEFSHMLPLFVNSQVLFFKALKMITIPLLKSIFLAKDKKKFKILAIIEGLSDISHIPNSSANFLRVKTIEGVFPKSYFQQLKNIDDIIKEIEENNMLQRWKSFNRMANQNLLQKIGNSNINKGFQFLANLTAIFNFLGQEGIGELAIMQK